MSVRRVWRAALPLAQGSGDARFQGVHANDTAVRTFALRHILRDARRSTAHRGAGSGPREPHSVPHRHECAAAPRHAARSGPRQIAKDKLTLVVLLDTIQTVRAE
jgi:hypothetical protein